jgi:two-component system, LytTR family, sensor histidine kinase AlgZ
MARRRYLSALRLPATEVWLPEFCQAATVYSAMLLAEIVVIIAVLAPGAAGADWWSSLTTGTVLAQWIALCNVALLCLLRRYLLRMPGGLALALMLSLLLTTTYCMAWLAFVVDRALNFGLMAKTQTLDHFAPGITAMALLMALLGLRYSYVHLQWRRQVETQARVEVEALTARIRPHFLFNSMNTIAGLVQVDADLAEQMIEDLSELFRAALNAGAADHSLQREFELCRHYLAIEQLRLGERLQVQWDVDEAPADLQVPPLLLQPLVENAVYHGVQPLPQGGLVSISARVSGKHLEIRIQNPLPANADSIPASVAKGHGMAQENVRQRLHYAYRGAARLALEQPGGYYAVTVILPLTTSRESRT